MRHASKVLLFVLCLGFLVGGCTCEKPEPWQLSPPEKPEKPPPPPPPPPVAVISVVPAGPTDEYWKGVRVGVAKAAPEMPRIGIAWRTPASADKAAQAQLVEQLVKEKAGAILLGPLDAEALAAPAKAAREAGIPVIVIGAALSDPESCDCVVADDPAAMGEAAAKAMIHALEGQSGKVVVLRFQPADPAAEDCEKAFVAALGPYKGITVITSDAWAARRPIGPPRPHARSSRNSAKTPSTASSAAMMSARRAWSSCSSRRPTPANSSRADTRRRCATRWRRGSSTPWF